MEIVMRNVGELIPYAKNTKLHDKKQIDNVANSIKRFGWQQPIVIDDEGTVVIGHCRLLAAKKLGMREVPCTVASGLTPEEIRELRIADNKTNESPWDVETLADEMQTLTFEGFDFGFDLLANEEDKEIVEDETPAVNEAEPPVTKMGDIWVMGKHRLMCGDSTDKESVKKLVDGAVVNLVYTDPPYGMNAVSKSGVLSKRYVSDIMGDDDNSVAIDSYLLAREMFNNARHVWWGANYYTECLPGAECWVVWNKNNGASDQTDCELAWTNFRSVVRMFTMASEKKNRVHPTQKPAKLFDEIVKKFEKDEHFENVLDLFGGSGSTMIACEQMNRKCFTMEFDPKYCDVIVKRWENFTGQKAQLLEE